MDATINDGLYATLEKVDGNLRIALTAEGREELADLAGRFGGDGEAVLLHLIEDHLCNGWSVVRPEEVAALTGSLILTDSDVRDDEGGLVSVGRVYWHPNYMVENPAETLAETGVFVMAGVDGE